MYNVKYIQHYFAKMYKVLIKCNLILQDPLNSDDDVSDLDIADLFDTNNVIVCQYEKVWYVVSSLSLTHLNIFISGLLLVSFKEKLMM